MAQPGTPQQSFNSGELSPLLHGRTDIKQFYAGVARMENVEAIPQGGFRQSPRSRRIGRVRHLLTDLGGTKVVTSGTFVAQGTVITIDLGSVKSVAAMQLGSFSASQDIDAALEAQYLDPADATWKTFAPAFHIRKLSRQRRAARPPGSPVLAQSLRWRLVKTPGTGVTFTFTTQPVYGESATLSVGRRLVAFTFSTTEAYDFVLTDFHIDVWRAGVFVGACASPYSGDQIRIANFEQRFDTMLMFHEDVAPAMIMRRGADHEWSFEAPPWTKIPLVDLGGSYVKKPDVWEVYLRWGTAGAVGLAVTLSINGEDTPAITVQAGPDWSGFITDLMAQIVALEGVEAGVTRNYAADTGHLALSITFTGDGNLGEPFTVSGRVVNGDAAITCSRTQKAQRGGEALMSVTRGYPTCARFYQDRLVMAGYKAKPGAMHASVTGEYFNQNINIEQVDGAILANLDTDGAEQIVHLERARHLLIFTTAAHYYISDRVLSRSAPTNIVHSESTGAAPGIPIVRQGDSLIYISANRALAYRAVYSDQSQAYESENLSLLASHLVNGIQTAAIQKPSEATDASRYYMVRADGVMVIGLLIPNQEVVAFTRWTTDGLVRGVSVNGAGEAHILAERTVGATQEVFLERLETGLVLDGSITQTLAVPANVVTGLDDHEGRQVYAEADGYMLGPYLVTAGAITLPKVSTVVTVGRWKRPRVVTLPANRQVADRVVVKNKCHVHTVRANVMNTTSIAIGANGVYLEGADDYAFEVEDCPLYEGGMAVDAPQAPLTREVVKDGLMGWTQDGLAEITQLRPGRFEVRDLVLERKG